MNMYTAQSAFRKGVAFSILMVAALTILPAAETPPPAIHVILDNSPALAAVLDDVADWVSSRFLERGAHVTLWSGDTGKPVNAENIASTLAASVTSASNMGVSLKTAASQSRSGGMSYVVAISVSQAGFSTLLADPDAALLKYSRTEEFRGWQAIVIALNIDTQVRKAAADWPAAR